MIKTKNQPDSPEAVVKILNSLMKKWFDMHFKEFSLPQLYGILEVHKRNNILISAPTGSGKTLTAFMSILNELVDSSIKGILENKIYAVYISPLKALNNDISKNLIEPLKQIEELHGSNLGINIAVRTGDTTQKDKAEMLKNPPHILITTPESLAILLSSTRFISLLDNVQWCIVDEIHALAENKRGTHLSISLERLSYINKYITRIGLSATVAPLEEVAKFLVGDRECVIAEAQFIKKADFKVLSPLKDLIDSDWSDLHNKTYELLHNLISSHKTTLVFTNTRSATERVVHTLKEKYPKEYVENLEDESENKIGAHHGSLSKLHRVKIENQLREGKLKVVVCSTSLELGIDIGYIDLVVCLGSPKSVARFLQRAGRAGHKLHDITKARIIVLDRDDLIECGVLMKSAIEKKIDKINIPKNALDVLAQQIYGMAIADVWDEEELFKTIKRSYCYSDLSKTDFNEVISFLSGEFVSLEDRNVYAKIWRKDGKIGKRGKLARVIYMTNIGTIPDQTRIKVKIGENIIGYLDEGFLERLRQGDIFVLGGETYRFLHAKGMSIQVQSASGRSPTVPSWVSERLPLSYDLANEIVRFRTLMHEKFEADMTKKDILAFINEYLYVDEIAAEAIYNYMFEQYEYSNELPTDRQILVEHYNDEGDKKIIFHTLYGRRVNDVLSRAVGYIIGLKTKKSVPIGINDNGFYIDIDKQMNIDSVIEKLRQSDLMELMKKAIDKTEVLRRRFRHCAVRSLMILRTYKGQTKNVGRQQVSSMILMNAVKRISDNFCILKEARREVLYDLMDIKNAQVIVDKLKNEEIKVKEIYTRIPSPFALDLVLQGRLDILKMEDKAEFLKRIHKMILAKISLKEKRNVDER